MVGGGRTGGAAPSFRYRMATAIRASAIRRARIIAVASGAFAVAMASIATVPSVWIIVKLISKHEEEVNIVQFLLKNKAQKLQNADKKVDFYIGIFFLDSQRHTVQYCLKDQFTNLKDPWRNRCYNCCMLKFENISFCIVLFLALFTSIIYLQTKRRIYRWCWVRNY